MGDYGPGGLNQQSKPSGCCLMDVGTHRHVGVGGPFDAFGGGFGVCQEKHSSKAQQADILVDWPDFGVIGADALKALIESIVDKMLQHPEVPMFIGCRGGIGRTGTVFAGLARALELDAANPVEWVRENYVYNAAETGAQIALTKAVDTSGVHDLVNAKLAEQLEEQPASRDQQHQLVR